MSNLFNVSAISVSESSSDDEEYMEEYDVQQQSSIHSFVWNANKNSRNNDRASAVSTKPSSTASTSSSPLGFLGGRVGASHLKNPLDGIFTQQQARVGAKKKEITERKGEYSSASIIAPSPPPGSSDDDVVESNPSSIAESSSHVSTVDMPETISTSAISSFNPPLQAVENEMTVGNEFSSPQPQSYSNIGGSEQDSTPAHEVIQLNSSLDDGVARDSMPAHEVIQLNSSLDDGVARDSMPAHEVVQQNSSLDDGVARDSMPTHDVRRYSLLAYTGSMRESTSAAPTPMSARRASLSYREEHSEDPPPASNNMFQPKSSVEDLLSFTRKERRQSVANATRYHDYNDDLMHDVLLESQSQRSEGETKEMVIKVNVDMSPSGLIASHVPLSPEQRVICCLISFFGIFVVII